MDKNSNITVEGLSGTKKQIYTWNNVAVGVGGIICGMVVHPNEPDLVYIRTDIGGAYRWNPSDETWIPLNDSFGIEDENLYGIDGIAIAPSDPNIVYIACGKYDWSDNHDVLKSVDRGKTWKRTNLNKVNLANHTSYGNERMDGESIAVDPNNSQIVYVGTRRDGLWRSTDGANTWSKVDEIPTGIINKGIRTVVFDDRLVLDKKTQVIYVGINGEGIYRSEDAGLTWNLVDYNINRPKRMVVASNGALYICDVEGVFKYKNDTMSCITPIKNDITPFKDKKDKKDKDDKKDKKDDKKDKEDDKKDKEDKKNDSLFNGITVHPTNPNIIMCGNQIGYGIYYSTDCGNNWVNLDSFAEFNFNTPWCNMSMRFSTITTIIIDPHDSNKVWGADGYTVWNTPDVNENKWYQLPKGIEQTVPLTLICPPTGATLLAGFYDVTGFRWEQDLTKYPSKRFNNPQSNEVTGMDFCESSPNNIVRVGSYNFGNSGAISYSSDNGETWEELNSGEYTLNGRVAMSATNPDIIIVLPIDDTPKITLDRGETWSKVSGIPSGVLINFWHLSQPIASDKVDGRRFYIYDPRTGYFYVSDNSGLSWSNKYTLPTQLNQWSHVKSMPTVSNEVWVSLGSEGLYRSSNAGETFDKLPNVQTCRLFSFGKNSPNHNKPTVFVYGTIDNEHGIFCSHNMGETWIKINDEDSKIGNAPTVMEGDRQVYGRVYIGTDGRGLYYSTFDEQIQLNLDLNLNLHLSLSIDLTNTKN